MIERFNKFLSSPNLPPDDDVLYWRERIVTVGLIGAAIFGAAVYIINVRITIQDQAWLWATIYTLAYAGVLVIALRRKLPYALRAGTMLSVLYILGIVSSLQFASAGDARIWFFGFVVLSCVFIGMRAGMIATVISTATLLGIGYAMTEGMMTAPDLTDYLSPRNFQAWLTTSIPFFTLGIMTVLSIGVMVHGLNRTLQRGRELAEDLEEDRSRLERRTKALERREVQVRTASEISRIISAELDPERLFNQVVELVRERFDLYYVGVFLVDENNVYARLQAGTGEQGRRMLEAGHKLAIGGTSMIGWTISRRQARIALDVGQDAVRFDNPYLPDTRSELALPMVTSHQVLGALTVQSTRPEAFDEDDIMVLQGVADGLATAIDNARLFQQTQASLREIRQLHQQYLGEAWTSKTQETELQYSLDQPASTESDAPAQSTKIEVPLKVMDQTIGTITLESNKPAWSPEDQSFIEAVADQAALALENLRLVEETQQIAQHNRIVADITSKVWASSDVDMILRTTLKELGQTLQASEGTITLNIPTMREDE